MVSMAVTLVAKNPMYFKSWEYVNPYTKDERDRNFKALRGELGRSLEDRNPSYAKALKAAQERMKNKKKNNS